MTDKKTTTKPSAPAAAKPAVKQKAFSFSKASRLNMVGVHPLLVTLAERTLEKSPIDFGVLKLGGFRTAEEQHGLYLKKRSKLDGYIQLSHHQLGNAIDLVPYVDGKHTWSDKKAFEKINKAVMAAWSEMKGKGVVLTWGGSWETFYDPAHYQIKNKS